MKQVALLLVFVAFFLTPAASAKTIELDAATIADINAAYAAGTLTAEKLVQLCLARIDAYDKQGPSLRAVITVNPKALDIARALDAERKAKGPRSPLHGIPIVLKDNYDTADLPTTGGSLLLEGWIPPDDAFVVKKLRDAGAIIIAKLNMSEFASGAARSSLGGAALNPHDPSRTPSGSSGGTGVAIAAAYATVGMGTDTGGSIRGPSTSNGIVGLKPTHGLLSRDGIIPLALSFDTGGPMARSVADVAVTLGIMTGVDPADEATKKSAGKFETDYTKFLKADALKGARIGVARDFLGADGDVDWVMEAAIAAMKKAGATVVDVRYPKWLLDVKTEFYNAIRYPEFAAQIKQYLAATGPKYPKSIDEMIDRVNSLPATRGDGAGPNPARWTLFKREAESGTLDDYRYTAVRDHGLPLVRSHRRRCVRLATARRDRLSHLVAAAGANCGNRCTGRRRRNSIGQQSGQLDRLPRPDRSGRIHWRLFAGRNFVPGPGVQRAEIAGARLQLRAGDARAASSRPHAAQSWRHDYRTGSTGNASALIDRHGQRRAISCGAVSARSRIRPVFRPGCRASAH